MRNVVWFCADQMRYDGIDCLGNETIRTPNIGSIGRTGTRFHRHLTPNQICSPSRASMFTGLYPRRHGLHRNGVALDESIDLIPRTLAHRGFCTHGIGKFHLQPLQAPAGRRMPESMAFWKTRESRDWRGPYYGFDTVDVVLGEGDFSVIAGHYAQWLRTRHPEALHLYTSEAALEPSPSDLFEVWKSAIPCELHYNFWIADRAIEFIDGASPQEPFFLYVSFPDPHHPFTPPRPYCDLYAPYSMPLPTVRDGELDLMPSYLVAAGDPWAEAGAGSYDRMPAQPVEQGCVITTEHISEDTMRLIIAHTYGMIGMIDDAVGRVLAALTRRGLLSNTLVLFTTDHGELLGDHGLLRKGPSPYRQLLQVPLLMCGPGIPEDRDEHTITSHIDLFATILEYLGLPEPETDGCSLSSLLRGDHSAWQRDAVYAEYYPRAFEEQYNQSIITERWRLTLYPKCSEWGELFDLKADPHEQRNLFHEPSARSIVVELTERMAVEFPPNPVIDSEPLGLY